MGILEKKLEAMGVESYLDLTDDEKETYKAWEKALKGRKITDADVADFLQSEIDSSMTKLVSQSLGEREDTFLKMEIQFIRKLQVFLAAPDEERKLAEQFISQQV